MKNSDDRNQAALDKLLSAVGEPGIAPDRIRHVRTAVLVAAHSMGRSSWQRTFGAYFGFRPAVLLATGLLGLVLGASLPAITLDDSGSAAFLEYHPQGFLTGDFG